MVSTASTVTRLLTPDTDRFTQWPVIVTVVVDAADVHDVLVAGEGLVLADA